MSSKLLLFTTSHPLPPPVDTRRTGVVQADRRAVFDDQGTFHPLGGTFFWLLQGLQDDRERALANLAWYADHGFDYVRILGQVDWTSPPGPIDPQWSDYQDRLADAIDTAYDSYGLRVELTIIGKGLNLNYSSITGKVIEVIKSRSEKLIDLEMVNEAEVDYPPYGHAVPVATMQGMVRQLRAAGVPNLIALSSGSNWEALATAAQACRADLFTVHPDRGPGDNKWRQVRQGWDAKAPGMCVSYNEPAGPNCSVADNQSPLQLALMRAVECLSGGALWVFHTGDMVGGVNDPSRGRHANIWEVPGVEAMAAAIRGADRYLPVGIENWAHANTGWVPPNPVTATQPDAYWPGSNHGVNKAYGANGGQQQFVQSICGVLDHADMRVSTGHTIAHADAYDPITGQIVGSVENIGAGSVWQFAGRSDTMAGYMLVGQYA